MALLAPLGTVLLALGDWTRQDCQKLKIYASVSSTLTLVSVDWVLGLRAVGIYCFQRYVTLVVATLIVIQTGLAIWSSTSFIVIGIPPVIPGCFVRPGLAPRLGISLYWFPAAFTDLVLLVLTILRIFPIWSNATQAQWTWIILRDQIFYYAVITAITIALDLLIFLNQNVIAFIMLPSGLTLPPILVFHLVLNLRSIAQSSTRSEFDESEPILMEDLLATEPIINHSIGDDLSQATRSTRRRVMPGRRENERDGI